MPRRVVALTAAAVLAGPWLAGCGSDESPTLDAGATTSTTEGDGDGDGATTTTTAGSADTAVPPVSVEIQQVAVTLTGDAVVPLPNEPAVGTAEATLTYDGDELCLTGTSTDLGAVTGGHVHAGLAGEPGPVVVDLGVESDGDGPFEGCAIVGAEGGVVLVDPASYFVQLHTADHPDGAVRAQLG